MSAIPPGLTSFDYNQRGGRFGYEFTRHFEDSDGDREALPVRLHVVMMAARGPTAVDSAVAYSFPLCGFSQEDWTPDEAWRFVHSQVVEFAHHVDVDCVDFVKMCWRLAKPVVVLGADGTETQLIMYFYADTQITPCYVFVHEDGIPDSVAQSLGQRY